MINRDVLRQENNTIESFFCCKKRSFESPTRQLLVRKLLKHQLIIRNDYAVRTFIYLL